MRLHEHEDIGTKLKQIRRDIEYARNKRTLRATKIALNAVLTKFKLLTENMHGIMMEDFPYIHDEDMRIVYKGY